MRDEAPWTERQSIYFRGSSSGMVGEANGVTLWDSASRSASSKLVTELDRDETRVWKMKLETSSVMEDGQAESQTSGLDKLRPPCKVIFMV